MATTADYIVMTDEASTIVPNPGAGELGEKRFTIPLPNAIELNSNRQRPILTFKAWTESGTINAEIDVNARRVRNLPGFQATSERSLHEVVDPDDLRAGANNDLLFRVVGGDRGAKLYISDVVLWFQREGFGPN
ncbi:MAG TPA: hypothetical protein VN643_03555 [Pyrinomonadaceae bacterium]|nr:hypothetical protein [Pyrinomonadaceae bacterium]